MKQSSFIKINPADSVVVCLRPFKKGETINVDGKDIEVMQDTPAGHKVLIKDAPEGENIIKYGYPIGHAKENLKAGQWVNENNLKTNLAGTLTYEYHPVDAHLDIPKENRTFKGFVRKNGDVGTRNEIWIVPTVGCVNGIGEQLVKRLTEETHLEGIDAIHCWHHNYGCSQLGGDHENTRKVLRDICLHPNAGGVLVLSLGCENNQPDAFMETLGDRTFTAFLCATQGFIFERRDATGFVSWRRVLSDRLSMTEEIFLEVVYHADGLVEELAAFAAVHQYRLCTEHLRNLCQHARAALGNKPVAEFSDKRVGGDAAEAVAASTFESYP